MIDVPGLNLYTNAISLELQQRLITFIDESLEKGRAGVLPGKTYSPIPPNFKLTGQSREMLQYGVYTHANRVEVGALVLPLPLLLHEVIQVLIQSHIISTSERPDTCTINIYAKGNWLPPHIDSHHFERPFATLSLVSPQNVVFTLHDTSLTLTMPIGSVLRVDGSAANEFTHQLPPATSKRISMTFRRLTHSMRKSIADTHSIAACTHRISKKKLKREKRRKVKALQRAMRSPSQQEVPVAPSAKPRSLPLPKQINESISLLQLDDGSHQTPLVEVKYVQQIYDTIAPHWHGTRYKAWPKVVEFLQCLSTSSLVCDIGCGNGKNLIECSRTGFAIGCDTSMELLNIAKKATDCDVTGADIMRLPYRSESFDAAVCIAVLHHISTIERRIQALNECMRILKRQGRLLLYAWAFEQDDGVSQHHFAQQDVLVPWHLKNACQNTSKTAEVYQRFCHVYMENELENLFAQLDACVCVEHIYKDTGNWALIVRKM